MRSILAFATLFFMLAINAGNAAGVCSIPLERILQTQPYFADSMTLHEKSADRMSFQHKDDPRIVATFTTDLPASSAGLSKSEYMNKYERGINNYADSVKGPHKQVETAFFTLEPLAWKIVENKTLPNIGPALEGKMYIRFSESCLVQAAFLSPDSTNLRNRWYELNAKIAELRATALPFVQTTPWEREDTAPTGLLAIAVGFIAPLLLIGLVYHSLQHITRLDHPSISTKTVVGMVAVMSSGLAFTHRDVFMSGLSILKYTDMFMLLATCFVVSVISLAFAQKATVLSLVTGSVTGLSLVASSVIGWTSDPVSMAVVGISMFVISILGFFAWSLSFSGLEQRT